MRLESSANDFERGAKNEFQLKAADVGVIQHIIICHDNSGLSSDWHLQQVLYRSADSSTQSSRKVSSHRTYSCNNRCDSSLASSGPA